MNNVDSYVGHALCADLQRACGVSNRIIGTLQHGGVEGYHDNKPPSVKRIVTRENLKELFKVILSCSLVVFDLHSSAIEDVEWVIKELKLASPNHDIVFVLISSVGVWASTKKDYEEVKNEEEEEEAAEEEGGQPKFKEYRPVVLTDKDAHRRIPAAKFEPWKTMETLALSLNPKPKVRTHVVGAGVLYGNAQDTFNELFKGAWLSQGSQRIFERAPGSPGRIWENGQNYIPCVHVRDVARLVREVVGDVKANEYLIAVDKAKLTQRDIVQGIVDNMSDKFTVPTVPADQADPSIVDEMTLDLIFEPSAQMLGPDFAWHCGEGLMANMEVVAQEFCKWRNLRPIKIAFLGPPGSKMEQFASTVSDHYYIPRVHFDYDELLKESLEAGGAFADEIQAELDKLAPEAEEEEGPPKPIPKLPLRMQSKMMRLRLSSNVCRFRGYVLEGYPESYQEAESLFIEPQLDEESGEWRMANGEVAETGEDGEEPPTRVIEKLCPEFMAVMQSSEARCKARLLAEEAEGAKFEEDFLEKMERYAINNLAEDGSPATSDFFLDRANIKPLEVDVDIRSEEEVFQSLRVYLEQKGTFFNYLRSEQEITAELHEAMKAKEQEEDERKRKLLEDRRAKETDQRSRRQGEEKERLKGIAESDQQLLETQSLPLRQYLMMNAVPVLTEGLIEICKVMPEDPVDYLAEYLFAHAHEIDSQILEHES